MRLCLSMAVTVLSLVCAPVATAQPLEAAAPGSVVCLDDNAWPGSGRITAAGGVYWLRPHLESDHAFGISAGGVTQVENFHYDPESAPTAVVAWENACGRGLRLRWFDFEHDADRINFIHPGGVAVLFPEIEGLAPVVATTAGQRLRFASSLEINSWDLEVTRWMEEGPHGCWQLGIGGAYRSIRHRYAGYVGQVQPPRVIVASDFNLLFEQEFEGIGPTVSAMLVRPLPSGLEAFLAGRLTVLFGDTDSDGLRQELRSGILVNQTVVDRTEDNVLTIAELEVGVQATLNVAAVELFVRPAFVAQVYFDGGNATNSDAHFGMVGGVVTAGIRY